MNPYFAEKYSFLRSFFFESVYLRNQRTQSFEILDFSNLRVFTIKKLPKIFWGGDFFETKAKVTENNSKVFLSNDFCRSKVDF